MKTLYSLSLTALLSLFCTAVQAQSWSPGDAPHKHSSYYNGRNLDYRRTPNRNNYRNSYNNAYRSTPTHDNYRSDRYRHSSAAECPVSFEVGMVSKRYGTYFGPGDRYHENLWGEDGRFLNGIQMGFAFQPMSYSGVGLRTGAFYELYFDRGWGVQDCGYDRFTEHDLYIPLQLAYRLPVGRFVNVDFNTGFGFNVAMAGIYRWWGRDGGTDWQEYGNYDRPDRVNAMWEFGASVSFDRFKFGMNYGLGLNDNEFYDNARTRQNKFTMSLGYEF